ncbi:syndecan-1-like [Lampris incognitus]|uniref:syndecan-1-like n=1 Tax=Lampris incognitus TaxID=2546036 RepID=UPI0024B4C0E4|nr:syndecan-1-like [Lampris incognitus]
MKISVTIFTLLATEFIPPISTAFSRTAEDFDELGYELDSSGSGSGDWSEQGSSSSERFTAKTENEIGKIKNIPQSNGEDRLNAAKAKGGARNNDDSGMSFDVPPWGGNDFGSTIGAKTKSFLQNKEVLAGVIAGGVTGLTLATAVAAVIIYKWRWKDERTYTRGQQIFPNRVSYI